MQTRPILVAALGAALAFFASCSGKSSGGAEDDGPVAPGVGDVCGSVRLTHYTAGSTGWCEFDRTQPLLPAFVRSGMTLAIAEPYDGSSYGGEPGESCGECWEIDTLGATRTVMVHDLCPIAGNPICAGGHFHFDLSSEAAQALQSSGLDEGKARRVACPVEGNVGLQVIDRNQWGYLRFQVVNHRIPVRSVEHRTAGGTTWSAAKRDGGAWHVLDGGETFGRDKPGGVFRITSAQGETLETPNVLTYDVPAHSTFDLGAQLTDQAQASGPSCIFEPPALVYGDGYGGIDEVRWTMNPWGTAKASEVTQGCYGGSCIRVDGLASASGFHVYYRQAFAAGIYSALSLRAQAVSGGGGLEIAASRGGVRCQGTAVTVGREWAEARIDLAATCTNLDTIDAVTVYGGAAMVLLLDDVRFEK